MSRHVLKKSKACLHAFMCTFLFSCFCLFLVDHYRVLDLFVYPIYALCQTMVIRMKQKTAFMLSLSVALRFY